VSKIVCPRVDLCRWCGVRKVRAAGKLFCQTCSDEEVEVIVRAEVDLVEVARHPIRQ